MVDSMASNCLCKVFKYLQGLNYFLIRNLRAVSVGVVVACGVNTLSLSLGNTTCQRQAFARRHQLVARLTFLVTDTHAVLSVQFHRGLTLALTDAATLLTVKEEVLIGACGSL